MILLLAVYSFDQLTRPVVPDRLADELRAEQEHAQTQEKMRKALEVQVKDLQVRISSRICRKPSIVILTMDPHVLTKLFNYCVQSKAQCIWYVLVAGSKLSSVTWSCAISEESQEIPTIDK